MLPKWPCLGEGMIHFSFSSQQIMGITGLSRRQLSYWRKTGLVAPSEQTTGGHSRYTFTDLVALKTAKKLIDAGVSVQRIRKSLQSLMAFLPNCQAPLSQLSLVTTGDMILVLHQDSAFEALTGQEWILDLAELEHEATQWKETLPQQSELFAAEDLELEQAGKTIRAVNQ